MTDMYSIGIIIYEIYSRKSPYEGEDFRDTIRKICDRRVNKRPPTPEMCPSKMSDLMKKCWSPDPEFRPKAKDLDLLLMDMNSRDAEPLEPEDNKEKQPRTGDMLYQLFPSKVADVLKRGEKVEPETHENVTVIFSETMNFNEMTRSVTPLKISQMLDRLYLALDKVASQHHVFKVETVGDAYMGVTNLENDQDDTHVKNAAEFAMAMVREASTILIDPENPQLGCINIRVGFHSGPVVSNVIGSLNPRYGLFGDTVNTASRMETNSKANRILCSESSKRLLVEQAPGIGVTCRGKIAVKGKGEMMVYWVESDNQDAPASAEQDGAQRRVGFAASGAPDEQDQDRQQGTTVDDHLWRRELKSHLQTMDSHSEDQEAPSKGPQNTAKHSKPGQKSGGKNIQMRRSRS
eukprot:scaffold1336_cov174-Amphora_coffeaeformis.AAC.5